MRLIAFYLFATVSFFSGAAYAEKTDLTMTGQQGDYYFFAVSKPWAQNKEYLEQVVKGICTGKTFCFSHVWDKKDGAPKTMPLTDNQSSEMLAMYRMNKNTGLSELYFNCKKFQGIPKAQCL